MGRCDGNSMRGFAAPGTHLFLPHGPPQTPRRPAGTPQNSIVEDAGTLGLIRGNNGQFKLSGIFKLSQQQHKKKKLFGK